MTQPFLGEIQPYPFGVVPKGWAQCNGQLLSIQQNAALFSLLGTFYGGNGVQNFALPNLQGEVPVGQGSGGGGSYVIGQAGGEPTHTLIFNEMPQHNHLVMTNQTAAATASTPSSSLVLGQTVGDGGSSLLLYGAGSPANTLGAQAVGTAGANQPHDNMAPYLTLNFCIALQGIFPSRN